MVHWLKRETRPAKHAKGRERGDELSHMTKKGNVHKIERLIQRGKYAVAVEVDATFYPEDDEAYLSAETCRLLDEVRRRAEAGDVEFLRQVGQVFELVEA